MLYRRILDADFDCRASLYPGVVLLGMLLVPGMAASHHSFGIYSDEVSELEGELVDVAWGNPHVKLTLSSLDSNSVESRWTLEGAAVYVLERRGISRDLFRVGETLTVAGRISARGMPELWLHSILLPDGREAMMIGGIDPRWTADTIGGDGILEVEDAASQNRGILRVWSQPALRPINYGAELPYIEPPPTGGAEWIERLNGLAERCEAMGMPGVMATPYPFEFTAEEDTLRLRGFSNNAMIDRSIHLDAEADVVPDITGHSVGQWETDNKLVVRTDSIDWPYFDDSTGVAQSPDLQTTEVFTLSDDQSRLDYQMIVTDPALFSSPTTVFETYWLALGESRAEPSFCQD
jgi:hypothetical protein